MSKVKIKINDVDELRNELDKIYESSSQVDLAKQSISLAKHIFYTIKVDYKNNNVVLNGFKVNENWQIGEARMYDVRLAGFKVHELAKNESFSIKSTAFRVAGQDVGSGHMRERAMVASDYAIKVINLLYPNELYQVKEERIWQINELKNIKIKQDTTIEEENVVSFNNLI